MLSLSLLLFGIVYRYAVRSDDNPMLKQGAVGAFAITRAVSQLNAPDNCVPIPLDCGPPLGYFSWPMIIQGRDTKTTQIEYCSLEAYKAVDRECCYVAMPLLNVFRLAGSESFAQGMVAYGVAALAIDFAFKRYDPQANLRHAKPAGSSEQLICNCTYRKWIKQA